MDRMEKGKKAEAIVKDLFDDAGFEVFNYGYEYTLPKLARREKKITGAAANYIRHQPDLIVVNKKNQAFFIEVKFRSKKLVISRDIFLYPCAYVILLTKNFIMAQSISNLKKGYYNFKPITSFLPFKDIPVDLIFKYVKKLRRQLGDETFFGQLVEKFVEDFTGAKLQKYFEKVEIVWKEGSTKQSPKKNFYKQSSYHKKPYYKKYNRRH